MSFFVVCPIFILSSGVLQNTMCEICDPRLFIVAVPMMVVPTVLSCVYDMPHIMILPLTFSVVLHCTWLAMHHYGNDCAVLNCVDDIFLVAVMVADAFAGKLQLLYSATIITGYCIRHMIMIVWLRRALYALVWLWIPMLCLAACGGIFGLVYGSFAGDNAIAGASVAIIFLASFVPREHYEYKIVSAGMMFALTIIASISHREELKYFHSAAGVAYAVELIRSMIALKDGTIPCEGATA